MNVRIVDGALTRELRRQVLRPLLGPGDALTGDELTGLVHFAALDDDGRVLSTCFLRPNPCPWRPVHLPGWQLRQMATATAAQGTGAGSAVLRGVADFIGAQGGGVLWCHARQTAVAFYRRAGLVEHGDPFVEHELPHRAMWRAVP